MDPIGSLRIVGQRLANRNWKSDAAANTETYGIASAALQVQSRQTTREEALVHGQIYHTP